MKYCVIFFILIQMMVILLSCFNAECTLVHGIGDQSGFRSKYTMMAPRIDCRRVYSIASSPLSLDVRFLAGKRVCVGSQNVKCSIRRASVLCYFACVVIRK